MITQFIDFFQICNSRNECFDMKARRDPTVIGTDEFGNPVVGTYI